MLTAATVGTGGWRSTPGTRAAGASDSVISRVRYSLACSSGVGVTNVDVLLLNNVQEEKKMTTWLRMF